jgi:hypothetical protein
MIEAVAAYTPNDAVYQPRIGKANKYIVNYTVADCMASDDSCAALAALV